MKISSLFFLLLLISCITKTCLAQEVPPVKKITWYQGIAGGYHFPAGSGYVTDNIDNPGGTTTVTSGRFTLGKGANLTYLVGCMFHPNFGAELNLTYSFGSNQPEHNYYRVDTVAVPYKVDQKINYRANMFRVNPAFVISADLKKIRPYAKLGLVMGWGTGYMDITEEVTFSGGKSFGVFKWKMEGAKGWGMSSSLGIKVVGEDNILFFAELSHINMGGTFKRAKRTTYTIDNVGYLKDLDTIDKEWEYVGSVEENAAQDPNSPRKVLKIKWPYDGVGINIGVNFRL